jgi:hypothetical protein
MIGPGSTSAAKHRGFSGGKPGPFRLRMTDKAPRPAVIEREKPLGYYPWHVNDYRSSRNANGLPWEARAILREVLDEIWLEGSVPDDITEIAAIARVPIEVVAKHWALIRDKMLKPLPGMDGMLLTNSRLEIERTAADRRRVKLANAGRLGGLAKAGKVAPPDQLSLGVVMTSGPSRLAMPSDAKQPSQAMLSNLEEKRLEEKEKRSAPTAASALGGALALDACPWCARDAGHEPAEDCRPRRLSPAEVGL